MAFRDGKEYLPSEQRRIDELSQQAEYAASVSEEAATGLTGLVDPTPFSNTPQRQAGLAEAFATQGRRVMAFQADQGMLSSSQVGMAMGATLRDKTQATIALQASEEAELRARQLKYEQMQRTSQASMRQLPDKAVRGLTPEEKATAERNRDPFSRQSRDPWRTRDLVSEDPFKDERSRSDASQRETRDAIMALKRIRPTADQLRTQFQKTADQTYGQYSGAIVAQARKQGMSESYIRGLQANLDADKQAVMNQAERMITDITGPDPGAAASALATLYSPERIRAVTEQRSNPLWGVLGAAAGFAISGGNPGGAMLGYNLGRATGEAVGGDGDAALAVGLGGLGAYGLNEYLGPSADETKNTLG